MQEDTSASDEEREESPEEKAAKAAAAAEAAAAAAQRAAANQRPLTEKFPLKRRVRGIPVAATGVSNILMSGTPQALNSLRGTGCCQQKVAPSPADSSSKLVLTPHPTVLSAACCCCLRCVVVVVESSCCDIMAQAAL